MVGAKECYDMKKTINLFLIGCIFVMSLMLPVEAQNTDAKADTFVPVLRFIAASDTHIQDDNNIHAERVQKMLAYTYREARADKNHPTLGRLIYRMFGFCGALLSA